MSPPADAVALARGQVAAARDDPAARLEPRLQRLYEWSAEELAWPFEQRHVWRSAHMPLAARVLERATRVR